jgi:hypothetical protein
MQQQVQQAIQQSSRDSLEGLYQGLNVGESTMLDMRGGGLSYLNVSG